MCTVCANVEAMDELPDLSRLSVAEKDQLIRDLWSWVRSLTVQVTTLQVRKLGSPISRPLSTG